MIFDTRPKVNVCVTQTGETYACATDESLLRGMLRLGRKGIPVGCVNGGCGVCKVRILDGVTGTDAVTRVLVGTTDGSDEWTTTGVHENVIAASWLALEDAVAYGLLKAGRVAEASPATD